MRLKTILNQIGIANYIRSIVYMVEDLFENNISIKNGILKDMHKGERCFVLGTGSSINDIDLSQLANEYTFGGNFINYYHEFHRIQLNYYISTPSYSLLKNLNPKLTYYTDPKVFSEEDIHKWINPNIRLRRCSIDPLTFFGRLDRDLTTSTKLFLGKGVKKFVEKKRMFQNNDIYYLKRGVPLLLAERQISDLTRRITLYDNVVFTMIAIAIYMGFKEIYLIGNDYTFEPAREFHFYDSILFSKKNNIELVLQWIERIATARRVELFKIEEDEEFYKPIYIQRNINRDAHWVLKKYLESLGIKVYNIVPECFESPIYKKISWFDLIQKLN